ncbi:MAG: flagellar motor switch protein FliN [Chromatocurvus sp.]
MSDEDDKADVATPADKPAESTPAAGEPLNELQGDASATGKGAEINLDLLMDIQVTLSVEIGRTRMSIKDLLALTQGSVVELGREVNEPLDLMVNGTLIARGEVVEADGRFGLRLIYVVSPTERLKKLK